MKKTSLRTLALSGLALASMAVGIPAQAQTATQTATQENIQKSYQQNMNAVSSANAAAAYTGNSAITQQLSQPGQAMMPAGMQTYMQPMVMGQNGMMVPAYPVPGQLPGQPGVEERPVVMRYNKKDIEGFYGVELPQRLFNNVPSDW